MIRKLGFQRDRYMTLLSQVGLARRCTLILLTWPATADVQGFTRSSLASADSQQSEIVEQQDPQGEGKATQQRLYLQH